MNRRLIVICAVMFLVALTVPAFAAVQNVKVSGDIATYGITRDNFDLGKKITATDGGEDNSNVFMSQVRLRVDADLTDNVSTTVRLLNERDWDQESAGNTNNNTEVDLDLAYVSLKEMLYSPLTVVIGRQLLRYGNAMIIGDPDTNRVETSGNSPIFNQDLSVRKSFDAVKAILNYDPLTVDLLYSKIDENTKIGGGTVTENDDVDLYGINANYKVGDAYDSVVEGYFFAKRDPNGASTNPVSDSPDQINAPGLRISTNPLKGFNLQIEQAWQFGAKNISTTNNRRREAMATQIIGTYALQLDSLMKYAPVVGAMFSRFSGDKNAASTTDDYKAWDPMYEDQGTGTIYNVLFQLTNTRVVNANVSVVPLEDLKFKLDWTALWLDKKLNVGRWGNNTANLYTLYQLNGGSFSPMMNQDKKFLGQEIDANLTYDYTEDVQFGLTGGLFVPGRAFAKGTSPAEPDGKENSPIASQLFASCKVTF